MAALSTLLRRSAVTVAPLLLAGCVGTTGLGWVEEPETSSSPKSQKGSEIGLNEPLPKGALEYAASITAPAVTDPEPETHYRLSHTITLGEVTEAPRQSLYVAGYPGAPGPVIINNYSGGSAPGLGYGYGYGFAFVGREGGARGARGGSTLNTSTSSSGAAPGPVQAGQNWPAPASFGPSFPFPTAPGGRAR
jgi:hypothetical protein